LQKANIFLRSPYHQWRINHSRLEKVRMPGSLKEETFIEIKSIAEPDKNGRVSPDQEPPSQRVLMPLRHSLGARILAGFLSMAFMSLVVALAAILYTSQAGTNLSTQVEVDQQVTDAVLRLQLAVERQFNAARGVLLSLPTEDTDREFTAAIKDYEVASVQLDKAFETINLPRKTSTQTEDLYIQFSKTINQVRAINLDDFKTTAIRTYEQNARREKDALISAIDNDLRLYREEIARKINATRGQGTLITILSLALVLMTTIGGIIVAALITRSITRPIRELAIVADAIRRGNLEVTVPPPRGNDEVATLASAMARMTDNLRQSRDRLQTSLNETKRRNRELTAINRVMASISGSLNLTQVLSDAMEELMSVSEMERSAVYLVSEDGQSMTMVAQRNQSDLYLQLYGQSINAGDPLSRVVAQTGEVVCVNDNVGQDPRLPEEIRNRIPVKSYLGIPLASSGRVVGVLSLTSVDPRIFSDNDLVLYKAVGSQIGIAVENAQLYSQAQLVAALEERNRLARDLHDSVTQTLFSITLTAESARAMIIKKPEKVETQLERLQNLARGALAEMRALIFQLRPAALEEQGLVSAMQKHIESVRSKDQVNIEFEVEGERRLSNEHEQSLYRITQEALNNIIKHAQATLVRVRLDMTDEWVRLTIHDDGVGFEVSLLESRNASERKSLGMTSMRERAELAGGSFKIESKPGEGTTITVELPLMFAPRPVGLGIN
jgi:signal transduction histidine kinase